MFPVLIRGGTTQTEVTEQNKVDHKKELNFLRQNSDVIDVWPQSVKLVKWYFNEKTFNVKRKYDYTLIDLWLVVRSEMSLMRKTDVPLW